MNSASNKNLIDVYGGDRAEKIKNFLLALLKNLPADKFGIVGGVAIHYWLTLFGLSSGKKDWNDIDIVVEKLTDIPKSLQKDFLIYHYHPPKDWYFHMALAHAPTRIKCHIFPYRPSHKKRFVKTPFEKTEVYLVSPEEQLIKTVYDIASLSENRHIDPKQFLDAEKLLKIVDIKLANKYWRENNFKEHPATIKKTVLKAQKFRKQHPGWVHNRPYRKPIDYQCQECKHDAGFTITPLKKIYKILQYN